MKVIVKDAVKDFVPIRLEIVIESADELVDLYHRLNVGKVDIERKADKTVPLPSEEYHYNHDDGPYMLWKKISAACNDLRLNTFSRGKQLS